MFFKKLFGLFFIGLLIFSLLGLFGRSAGPGFNDAYRQGFLDGQQSAVAAGESAEGAKTAVPNAAPSGTNIYYRDHGFFFPGPPLLLCLVPLFAFGFMMLASGKRRRGYRGGWGPGGPGGPCGPWRHGPWGQWEDDPKEKSPDDIDDGPAEPAMQA
jgi:hypothetical protein